MALLKQKVKASTLVESLIAMVIVLLCMGIASMVYVNVISANNSRIVLKAEMTLIEIAYKTKQEKTFIDEDIESTGFVVHKKAMRAEYAQNLTVLLLKAVNKKGYTLAEHKELIVQ